MRHLKLFLVTIFIAISPSYGQEYPDGSRFIEVDAHVSFVSKQMIFHPELLTTLLTENLDNDFDKTRAIYVWIARNIEYDLNAYLNGKIDNQEIFDVLGKGKAICSGFSNLFTFLCQQANIKAEIVEGNAKVLGYQNNVIFTNLNHAWNAVNIYGYWYLLDVTWATGDPFLFNKLDKNVDLNAHFLVPPETFIKTHLPADPDWQLLKDKVSITEFKSGEIKNSSYENKPNHLPKNYLIMSEFDKSIFKIKRKIEFNSENVGFKKELSFAYIFKGISLTDEIWKMTFNNLIDTSEVFCTYFYAYMDSAKTTISSLDSSKNQYLIEKVMFEIEFQKGVFNFEIGSEIYVKSNELKINSDKVNRKNEDFLKTSSDYFRKVGTSSIYYNSAKEYLALINEIP